MDARTVAVAAVIAMILAVGFNVGAITAGGVDPRLFWNAGVALGAISIGLLAGVPLYARLDRVERANARLSYEVACLREDLGVHKVHDRDALKEAAGLEITGPHNVQRIQRH